MSVIPDKWIIIKFQKDEEAVYKVFGMWQGGYLHGNSWRLNSGITKVEEGDNEYRFHGHSGSIYICDKNSYGLTIYGGAIIADWQTEADTRDNYTIEVLDESTDFINLI